jgi:hypothetical protein
MGTRSTIAHDGIQPLHLPTSLDNLTLRKVGKSGVVW